MRHAKKALLATALVHGWLKYLFALNVTSLRTTSEGAGDALPWAYRCVCVSRDLSKLGYLKTLLETAEGGGFSPSHTHTHTHTHTHIHTHTYKLEVRHHPAPSLVVPHACHIGIEAFANGLLIVVSTVRSWVHTCFPEHHLKVHFLRIRSSNTAFGTRAHEGGTNVTIHKDECNNTTPNLTSQVCLLQRAATLDIRTVSHMYIVSIRSQNLIVSLWIPKRVKMGLQMFLENRKRTQIMTTC
jgi:hypothetical protein